MALSLKVDTEEIPSILKMLGLGGMPAAADDTGGTPPIDSSLAGEAQPEAQPNAQPAPDAPAASSIASTHDTAQPPTKLLRLQQALGSDVPTPPLQVPNQYGVPDASPPPADLAQSMADGTAKIDPTFRERHPNIFKTLGAVTDFAEAAGPGVGAKTFGEGFSAAAAEGPRKAKEELEQATGKANLAHTQAATEQMKTQVTLPNGMTVPFALAQKLYPAELAEMGKDKRNAATLDSRESIAGDKNALALRKQGLKIDPATGKQVPLSRDEMSESEQATLDLKQSQQDAAAARAELDRQKNNPDSPAYKAAIGRLQIAQKNADTAAGRLGIETKKYMGDYFGTDDKGNPLPGAPTDDSGKPIGTRVANAGAASADRLKRGDLARNATQNANSIQQIVANRPDLFGAIAGRITSVQQMLGSDDPDIARLGVEIHNLALASNGAHGVRSAQAVHDTENEIINRWRAGPTAVGAALDSMKQSLGTFIEDQKHGKRPVPATTGTAQTAPSGKYSDLGFVPVQPKK